MIRVVGACAHATTAKMSTNPYGYVVARDDKALDRASVEKICITVPAQPGQTHKIERNGLLVRHKDAVATVLMCHGFMCDQRDLNPFRRLFKRGRYNIMSFDFRAHGQNRKGQCCTFGRDEAYDVIAAARFLRNHPDLQNKPVFVYGFSMGAVAAIEAQGKDGKLFDAMVLDCPFDSSEGVVKRGLDRATFSLMGYEFKVPGRHLLEKYAFHPYVQALLKMVFKAMTHWDVRDMNVQMCPLNPIKTIASVSVPTFFIHCKNDKKVSIASMKRMFNQSGAEYKKLWLTNGRHHFDSYFYSPERYTNQVREFLEKVIAGKLQKIKHAQVIEDSENALT